MTKTGKLKIINLLLAINIVIIALSALLSRTLQPQGLYGVAHVIPGIVLLILLGFHIALNAGWIKSTYFKKKRS